MIALMDRVATFKSFIKQKPDDPFPRYGLAMEYRNTGQHEKAHAVFAELMDKFPDYLATYLMAGGNLESMGRLDEAKGVYKKGIKASGKKGDTHTKGELEAALAGLS